jgi:hypothetical protein
MSLINDALKRASQSDKNRPRPAGLPPAMQPAPERRRSILPVLAVVFIAGLLASAGWFGWRSLSLPGNPAPVTARSAPVIVPPPARVEPAPAPVPAPPPAAVAIPANTNTVPAPPPAAESTNVEAPALRSEPAPAPAPPPPPPSFPELKLQGIFYSRANPRAIINGQIKAENDHIGEVRIVTITQNKITVEWNGRTNDLILQGP